MIELVSYLYPAYLRVGGTAADRLIFETNDLDNNEPCVQNDVNNTFIMTGKNRLRYVLHFKDVLGHFASVIQQTVTKIKSLIQSYK